MRHDPTRGGRRAARVLILGLSSLLLGVGAHLSGGGSLPGVGLLAVTIVPLGLVATSLTRRRCSLPVLTGVLIIEQLGLHAILSTADQTLMITGGTHAGHLVSVLGSAAGPTMITTPAMWLAHLAATLLTAALLARGEAAWWRLVDTVVAVVRLRHRRARKRPSATPPLSASFSPARLHVHTPRRGPPVAFA